MQDGAEPGTRAAGTETHSPQGPEVISGERLRGHTGQAHLADVPVAPRVRLRNVDHLALNTVDMRKTVEFYCGVLELRLQKSSARRPTCPSR